jgi:hypothetical protein
MKLEDTGRGRRRPETALTLREKINLLPIQVFKPRIVHTVASMTKVEQNKNLNHCSVHNCIHEFIFIDINPIEDKYTS